MLDMHPDVFTPRVYVGYWHSFGPFAFLPHPQCLVDHRWDARRRRQIVSYLDAGRVFANYMGFSRCRFCRTINGTADLTDGLWIWPEGLGHYVATHGVRLPDEFVAHAERSGFRVPDAPHLDLVPANWRTFWEDWCAENGRFGAELHLVREERHRTMRSAACSPENESPVSMWQRFKARLARLTHRE